MTTPLTGACIFGQSGGPTSVINASACGVFETALKSPYITTVYGAAHGIKGVLNDQLYIIDQEDPQELARLPYTPSSALGSVRYKLKDPEVDDTDYKRRNSWPLRLSVAGSRNAAAHHQLCSLHQALPGGSRGVSRSGCHLRM